MNSSSPLPHRGQGGPDATQQESRSAARTGSADKLYLVNSVCFCFIFTSAFHVEQWRGKHSNDPEGIWDWDPNTLGVSRSIF